jgi:hypothetical protein
MKTVTIQGSSCLVDDSHHVQGSTAVGPASLNILQCIHLSIKLNIKSAIFLKYTFTLSIYQHIHNSHDSQYLLWLQLWHLHVEYCAVTQSVPRQHDIGTKYFCSKSYWPHPSSSRIGRSPLVTCIYLLIHCLQTYSPGNKLVQEIYFFSFRLTSFPMTSLLYLFILESIGAWLPLIFAIKLLSTMTVWALQITSAYR